MEIIASDPAGIARAVEQLKAGGLIALPTETVYGLGADARDGKAVAAIYHAKGRPSFNPLIIHVADLETALQYAEVGEHARLLAKTFWPGALTLVLPLKAQSGLSSLVTAGLDTVAVRIPAHPVAQSILRAFNGPVAAPSANPSGRISATTAAHVAAGLAGADVLVLDAGRSDIGLESTIIAAGDPPTLLRAGGIAAEKIEAALGQKLALPEVGKITAPGQLSSHYAPRAALRLNATQFREDEVSLGFGAMAATRNLSPQGDLLEAAANLFDHLHQLDEMSAPIAVAPIPENGLGRAINDRLRRAAAPRGR
ncbi:MAG: L-threonylcarbamoyladenylate synthase [Roseobacter sp.]